MRRTRVRPLPSGTVRPQAALLFATGCFASGIGLYAYAAGWPLVVTGLTVVFIYNGLYTPLKPVTSLSLLLGGIAGALPPMVGWLAVGGSPTAPPAAAFCTALYLWQVPHFWSIADQHREDYRAAGLAMPSDGLPSESLSRIRTLWMAATLVALALAVVFLYNDFIPHHPMLPA